MKTASKKMEIALLKQHVSYQLGLKPSMAAATAVTNLLNAMDADKSYEYFRIQEYVDAHYADTKRLPSIHEMLHLLEDLELGWKRYFMGCSHPDSYFWKHHLAVKAKIPCQCCLYWRGRLMQLAIDAALVTCGVLTYNFFS